MRLLLDEHLDPEIAVELRRRGHDALAVAADAALRGLGDRALFDLASERAWVIVTSDARDFLRLFEERVSTREPSAGLLLVSTRRHPLRDRGGLVRALAAALDAGELLVGTVRWLDGARGSDLTRRGG